MSKCTLFKVISKKVWELICQNHSRHNRLTEEGITRQTIIAMIQDYVEENMVFNVFAQKSKNEVNTGSDLEVYLDIGQQRFQRILLQAKLMEINGCFEHLDRDSGTTGRKQYITLKSFANQIKSDAYYLMYNGCPNYKFLGNDCAGLYDEKQFGCAIMNVDDIIKHCEDNSTGTMGSAYDPQPFGKPWRFLSCCDYEQLNGNRLYDLDEIDMDSYFSNLFTGKVIYNPDIVNDNEEVHTNGWRPSARIIISDSKLKKNSDGFLNFQSNR